MVAAYQPHFRLAFGGSLFTTEQWVCRLNVTSSTTLLTDAEADTSMAGLVAAISDFVASADTLLGTAVALEYVKFNRITPTGHYATPSTSRTTLIDPALNGAGSSNMPPQVAIAVSLLTDSTRGKAHRGRIYLPCLVSQISGAGLIGSSGLSLLTPRAHTLIAAVNAALPSPNAVSVLSSTGEAKHVTGIAVGKVYDTQRRRRRSLREDPYSLSAVDL